MVPEVRSQKTSLEVCERKKDFERAVEMCKSSDITDNQSRGASNKANMCVGKIVL